MRPLAVMAALRQINPVELSVLHRIDSVGVVPKSFHPGGAGFKAVLSDLERRFKVTSKSLEDGHSPACVKIETGTVCDGRCFPDTFRQIFAKLNHDGHLLLNPISTSAMHEACGLAAKCALAKWAPSCLPSVKHLLALLVEEDSCGMPRLVIHIDPKAAQPDDPMAPQRIYREELEAERQLVGDPAFLAYTHALKTDTATEFPLVACYSVARWFGINVSVTHWNVCTGITHFFFAPDSLKTMCAPGLGRRCDTLSSSDIGDVTAPARGVTRTAEIALIRDHFTPVWSDSFGSNSVDPTDNLVTPGKAIVAGSDHDRDIALAIHLNLHTMCPNLNSARAPPGHMHLGHGP